MTTAIFLGFVGGLGSLGLIASLRSRHLPLESLAAAMTKPIETRPTPAPSDLGRIGRSAAEWVQGQPFTSRLAWTTVAQSLAITSTPLDQLATQVLLWGGLGLMGSPFVWLGLQAVGLRLPLGALVMFTPLITLGGALLPVTAVLRRARERRRHFRVVVGCFVDLVVFELAGGTGIEGALSPRPRPVRTGPHSGWHVPCSLLVTAEFRPGQRSLRSEERSVFPSSSNSRRRSSSRAPKAPASASHCRREPRHSGATSRRTKSRRPMP